MKVLIADDDPISRRLLYQCLSAAGYEPSLASDGLEALSVLEQPGSPRLAVLDWMMPYIDGLQICRTMRRRASEAYVYIVLLTSRGKKEEIIAGLEAGADDYLIKPFDLLELKARLRTGCRILELQDQVLAAKELLRTQATHDALTGTWNHVAILDLLEQELIRSRRGSVPMAVIMADLDHFKHVNDTYGHPAGDIVLLEAARRMQKTVRSYDLLGRYGGEEFLVVAPGCDLAEAGHLAERLREAVGGTPIHIPSATLSLTVSLGAAVAMPDMNADELLHAADEALYEAKRHGRNIVTVKAY